MLYFYVCDIKRVTDWADKVFSVAELVFPHPKNVGGTQARLVREQRGLVGVSLLSAEQVSPHRPPHFTFYPPHDVTSAGWFKSAPGNFTAPKINAAAAAPRN